MARRTRRPGEKRRQSRGEVQAGLRAQALATEVPSGCDVCVIGGGASGLAAAIAAADAGATVVVLERDLECGKKILATGNGRCNLANLEFGDIKRAIRHYRNPHFVKRCCTKDFLADVMALFDECGLLLGADAYLEDGYQDIRLFPHSRQAASVRNALLARARTLGVTLACARTVLAVSPEGPGGTFRVSFADPSREPASIACSAVVLATGGGVTQVLDAFDIPQVPTSPVLCPLACEMGPLSALDGRKARVAASLTRGRDTISHNRGELLLRSWGISGILAFNLSRKAQPDDIVWLDLVRGHVSQARLSSEASDATEPRSGGDAADAHGEKGHTARDAIMKRYSYLRRIIDPNDTGTLAPGSLDGIIDPVVAEAIEGMARSRWHLPGLPQKDLPPRDETEVDAAIRLMTRLPLRVTGTAMEELSQVTRGGLSTGAFSPRTLECLAHPGVFACGEALDVDGDCGGFNLGWAWKSGLVAGGAAARRSAGEDPASGAEEPDVPEGEKR